MKFCQFVLKILSETKFWRKSRAITPGTNVPRMMCNNPMLDLVNINAYIKFDEILSICSQDIEWKQNYDGMMDGQNEITQIQYSPHFFKVRL